MPLQCFFCTLQVDSADALATHQSIHIEGRKRPFHCTLCSYSANRKHKLADHMGTHRRGILYYCLHCPFVASNMTAQTRHKSTHSTEESLSAENIRFQKSLGKSEASSEEMDAIPENEFSTLQVDCNKNNDDNTVKNYFQPEISIQVKQEVLYACPICNFNTTSSSEMEEHLDEAEEDELFTCDECDLTFCSFQSVTVHREIHLEENPGDSFEFQNDLLDSSLRWNSSDQALQDEPVGSSRGPETMFSVKEERSSGQVSSKGLSGDESEGDAFDPDWKARTISRGPTSKPDAPSATACLSFKSGSSRAVIPAKSSPMQIIASTSHSKKSPAKGSANSRASLKKRKKSSQKLKKSNQSSKTLARRTCKLCNKVFTCPSSLNLHLRTHTGEKPFKCHKCSFSTSQKGNLRAHLETHNGILVKCKFCNYTGICTSTVNAHIRADHPDADNWRLQGKPNVEGEVLVPSPRILKKSKCNWNRNMFRPPSLAFAVKKFMGQVVMQELQQNFQQFDVKPRILNERVPIPNKGFHCNLCNITCKSVETFRRHDCTEKRYGCNQCSYTSRTMYHLRRHWQTHKGGVLESCPDCSYKTSSTRGLVVHLREAGHGIKYRAEFSSL